MTLVPSGSSLPEALVGLAAEINEAHVRVVRAGVEAVDNAIIVGKKLLESRRQLDDGTWRWWFNARVQVDYSTALRYMRVAEHETEIRSAQPQSLADAMRLLAGEPRRGRGPRVYSEEEVAHMRELAPRIGVKPTATQLGVSPSTVHRYAADLLPDTTARRRRLTPELSELDALAELLTPTRTEISSAVRACASVNSYQTWLRLSAYALAKARELRSR